MHFYRLSDRDVLAMPLKRFWFLNRSIDRIVAEKDIRMAKVAAMAQSGEGLQALFDDLRKQMGTVVEIDEVKAALSEELDHEGLASIRGMGKVR